MKLIILFGPPYSGKGTQGELLAKKLQYAHISTDDILRKEKESNTEIGIVAQEYSNKGLLVPDSILEKIIDRVLDDHARATGIILDGYPRTIVQAQTLFSLAQKHGGDIKKVVFLEVPQDELVKRGIERGKTSTREDDRNPIIINKRIEVYHAETKPVGEYYAMAGLITHIQGEGDISEILDRIIAAVQ